MLAAAHFGPAGGFFRHRCFFTIGNVVTKVLVGGCNLLVNWNFTLLCVVKVCMGVRIKVMRSACLFILWC